MTCLFSTKTKFKNEIYEPATESPPHMRGTVKPRLTNMERFRITPAYAGNRTSAAMLSGFSADHPRVCGEQQTSTAGLKTEQGSPPRMRGTVNDSINYSRVERITPAYAGNRAFDCSGLIVY